MSMSPFPVIQLDREVVAAISGALRPGRPDLGAPDINPMTGGIVVGLVGLRNDVDVVAETGRWGSTRSRTDHKDRVPHASGTQSAAIDWARGDGHSPLAARVRHLNDKKNPGHWRSADAPVVSDKLYPSIAKK